VLMRKLLPEERSKDSRSWHLELSNRDILGCSGSNALFAYESAILITHLVVTPGSKDGYEVESGSRRAPEGESSTF
jgi:hypothetical protein